MDTVSQAASCGSDSTLLSYLSVPNGACAHMLTIPPGRPGSQRELPQHHPHLPHGLRLTQRPSVKIELHSTGFPPPEVGEHSPQSQQLLAPNFLVQPEPTLTFPKHSLNG